MKTYWISKYALSDGIEEVQTDDEPSEHGYLSVRARFTSFKLGKDIHESLSQAITEAYNKRLRKIASLRKSIAKLEKLSFEVKP